MNRVPRADSALTVPWTGVQGRPDTIAAAAPTVVERIIVQTAPAAPSAAAGTTYIFTWAPGTLRALETATVDFSVIVANPGDQIAVGAPYALTAGQISAAVVAMQTVRLSVTNMDSTTVVLPSGVWKLRLFK